MEVNGLFHTPAVLPLGRAPQYTLNRSGNQSRSGYDECVIFFHLMSEKTVNLLCGSNSLPVCLVSSLATNFPNGRILRYIREDLSS